MAHQRLMIVGKKDLYSAAELAEEGPRTPALVRAIETFTVTHAWVPYLDTEVIEQNK